VTYTEASRNHPWEGLASTADTGLIMSTYGGEIY